MRKFERLIAVTILWCFVPAAGTNWLATLRAASPPSPSVAKQDAALFGAGAKVGVKPISDEQLARAIRAVFNADRVDVFAGREGPARHVTFKQTTKPADSHFGKGAKTAIWLTAATVGSYWAWKTFSCTRGTDCN